MATSDVDGWLNRLGRLAGRRVPATLLSAFAIILIAYQGLGFGLWAGLTQWLTRHGRVSVFLAAPLAMLIAEGVLAFPFKSYLAMTVWRAWPLTQVAELGGPAAVSALIVAINVAVSELLPWKDRGARSLRPVAYFIGCLAFILLLGSARGYQVEHLEQASPVVNIGVIQPNFGIVSVREREHNGAAYVAELRKAASQLADSGVDLIVLPESSWPYLWDRGMKQIYPRGHPWEILGGDKSALLIGTLSHDFGRTAVYNSAVLVNKHRAISGIYDKRRLLPIGEQLPEWMQRRFPRYSRVLREQTAESPDLVAGAGDAVLSTNGWRVGVYLCSEDLISNIASSGSGLRPQFLVSLANDAWFASGVGAYQHLALSSFRAIEERRPLVRATNTGYSAFFDSLGRVELLGSWRDVPEQVGAGQFETFHAKVKLMDTPSVGPLTRASVLSIAMALLLIAAVLARAGQPSSSAG